MAEYPRSQPKRSIASDTINGPLAEPSVTASDPQVAIAVALIRVGNTSARYANFTAALP